MNCVANGGLGGNGPVGVGVLVQRVEAMVARWGDTRYSDAMAGVRTSVGNEALYRGLGRWWWWLWRGRE